MLPLNEAIRLPMPESLASPNVGRARLAIGLVQGILLYWLYRAGNDLSWPFTDPFVYAPLLLVLVLAPVMLVSSLGQMDARRCAIWLAAAVAIIVALAIHDAWRKALPAAQASPMPSAVLVFILAAGCFIAHSLVLAGTGERRRIASYPGYFETAWKLGVQLAFSALFIGVVWLVLWMGAMLFMLIRLSFLEHWLQSGLGIPVIALSFAWAMHITDVRPAIVRGIRTLLLVLMSWILPVATLIVGGFLASLLFTGLMPLWETRRASMVLLGAAGVLVILINAAWQNGATGASVAPAIRASARAAALLLAPIVAIAIYALGLRVGEHGWTTDRIIAAACLLVAACYALGYAPAALRKGWLGAIAGVNVATAFVVLGVLLALFSPLADPARLSVNHQLGRLATGKVAAASFDYGYLRFEGGRYGQAALAQLRAGAAGKDAEAIRLGVDEALRMRGPHERHGPERRAPVDLAANLTVWPSAARLPESFLRHARDVGPFSYPVCLRQAGEKCDVFMLDLTGDGRPEMVVVGDYRGGGAAAMGEDAQGKWKQIGTLPYDLAGCKPLREALAEGRARAVAPAVSDLEIDGQRIPVRLDYFEAHICPK